MEKKFDPFPLPPVPDGPMGGGSKAALAAAVRSVPKGEMWRPDAQEYLKQCYARVWLSLCLDRGIEPAAAVSWTGRGHRAVLPAFVRAAAALGAPRPEMIPDWYAPKVAELAAALWRGVKAGPAPLSRIGQCSTGGGNPLGRGPANPPAWTGGAA
jgi:hypothetical protein